MPKEVGYYSIHLKLACESMMWPKVSVDVDLGYMVQFCLKQTKIKVMLYHREKMQDSYSKQGIGCKLH